MGELIDKIEGAGFVWTTSDRTLSAFPKGIREGEILTAPMVLILDPDDAAEDKATMVPDLLAWENWETRLKEFRRIGWWRGHTERLRDPLAVPGAQLAGPAEPDRGAPLG